MGQEVNPEDAEAPSRAPFKMLRPSPPDDLASSGFLSPCSIHVHVQEGVVSRQTLRLGCTQHLVVTADEDQRDLLLGEIASGLSAGVPEPVAPPGQ
jgi:hypothetical protein